MLKILGPVRLRVEGRELAVSGAKARAVLAALALQVNRAVSIDRLIDDIWGDNPPQTARNAIQVYVSAVRRGLAPVADRFRLESRPGGYLLAADPQQIDWHRFEELVAEARSAQHYGDIAAVAKRLRVALALWDGPALADVGAARLGEVAGARMEEARLTALADRIDADLALGGSDLVGELRELVARFPLHERFAGQLMLALYRAGRRGDALSLYQDTRRRMIEEIGLEPGDQLHDVHQAILTGEVVTGRTATSSMRPRDSRTSSDFVGRWTEIAELTQLLRERPLVSLVGAPGAGKSRLAAELSRRIDGEYSDGCWRIEFDGVNDPELVPTAVADAMGIGIRAGATPIEDLRSWLAGRDLLLILDNCEHLRTACAALIAAIQTDKSALRILATSRQPLTAPNETVYRLQPLPVPTAISTAIREIGQAESVELFCLRAKAIRPQFQLTEETAPTVAAICRTVEGLPLAIELAATRLGVLSVTELATRLTDQLGILNARADQRQPRLRSLRATLDVSFALLTDEERQFLAELSVFVGGFTVDAEEAVATDPQDATPLDALQELVDRSLVIVDMQEDETRFRLLEVVRQYATRLLPESVLAEVGNRHVCYFHNLAGRAREERRERRQYWLWRLNLERRNLHAALEWALRHDQLTLALKLVASLSWWWMNTPREGLHWCRRVLSASGGAAQSDRLSALLSAAMLASYASHEEGVRYAREAYEFASATGDLLGQVRALQQISDIAYEQGDLRLAGESADRALDAVVGLDDPYALGRCQLTVAYNHLAEVRTEAARRAADESAAAFRTAGDKGARAEARLVIAEALTLDERFSDADELLERIMIVFRHDDSREYLARAATLLAWIRQHGGRSTDAEQLIAEAFEIHADIAQTWAVAHDLDIVAVIRADQQRCAESAVLLGAAEAIRAEMGARLVPRDHKVRTRAEQQCRNVLGPDDYRDLLRQGAAAYDSAAAIALITPSDPRSTLLGKASD